MIMSKQLHDYFVERSKRNCETNEQLLEFVANVKEFTKENIQESWHYFFHEACILIENIANEGRQKNPNHLKENTFDDLKKENHELHKHLLPKNYKCSFANPRFSVKHFGKLPGQINCYFFIQLIRLTGLTTENYQLLLNRALRLFQTYFLMWYKRNQRRSYNLRSKPYSEMMKFVIYKHLQENQDRNIKMRFSKEHTFYTDWVRNADLNDLRYLFYYGNYVSDNEIETAKFLNTLPQSKIDEVMVQTAKSYILGFDEAKKDYTKKKTVVLIFNIGMERLARSLMKELESKYNLEVLIPYVPSNDYAKQFDYDHRFSNAFFFDSNFVDTMLKTTENSFEKYKDSINEISGTILFDAFGAKPFAPRENKRSMKYTTSQIQLAQEFRAKQSILQSKYYKRSETSFCIIGFPTPEIGKNFEAIFDKMVDINMLDSERWQNIHQHLIDVLDQADKVIVQGCKKNKTDIVVRLPKINNPKVETNFANCVATVNIPVGEVFATPQLKGTKGVLHLPKTFLRGLLYKDLKLTFRNGRIAKYSCKNYKRTRENKKYIEENLIFPHKSLPLGEFAIGTNTLAYAMAKKFKIVNVLPILIIEKMGPHFAIGDTCYTREEDTPAYNPDGKEIISRDNEQTILRKTDQMKAYTNIHLDITLPYDEIGLIQAVKKDGTTIDIIRKGRFVLPGTKELNEYLYTHRKSE